MAIISNSVEMLDGVQYRLTSKGWIIEKCVDPDVTRLYVPDKLFGHTVCGIDEGAFEKHPNLTRIKLPDSLSIIGARAFKDCCKLRTVVCLAAFVDIKSEAFFNCCSLLYFVANQILVGEKAFWECYKLVTLDCVINGVLSHAFSSCSSLNRPIVFSRNIKRFHINAFESSGVTQLQFQGKLPKINNDNNIDLEKYIWCCTKKSNLAELAYLGCNVQIT